MMTRQATSGARLSAWAAIAAMPALAWILGTTANAAANRLGSPAPVLTDAVVAGAAALGAACCVVLAATSLMLLASPQDSAVQRLAARATPAAWRRVVSIAVAGGLASAVAVPASASTGAGGWVEPPSASQAGWVSPAPQPSVPVAAAGQTSPTRYARLAPVDRPDLSSVGSSSASVGVTAVEPLRSIAPPPAGDEPSSPPSLYTVEAGDTLWDITARIHGGDGAQIAAAWPALHEANAAVIGDDPDIILPGQELTIPAGWER